MNKILIGYMPIGPTYKDRVVTNLLNFDGYKFFDVLILTDDPGYPEFDKISHMPNVIIDDINKHRELYPDFLEYEPLAKEKNLEDVYRDEVAGWRIVFPMNLQRFVLNYENVDDYPFIMVSDCDMIPIFEDDGGYGRLINYLENEMPVNSVSSNRAYQEWQDRGDILEFTKKWSELMGKTVDLSTPIDTFDNPFKIYKFENSEKRKSFFNLWNATLLDLFRNPEIHVVHGSWNFSCEMLLAVLYKIEGIRVNKEREHYIGVGSIKTHTYPEDRFWHDVSARNFNLEGKTRSEFIKNNEEGLKKFYKDYGQHYPY